MNNAREDYLRICSVFTFYTCGENIARNAEWLNEEGEGNNKNEPSEDRVGAGEIGDSSSKNSGEYAENCFEIKSGAEYFMFPLGVCDKVTSNYLTNTE